MQECTFCKSEVRDDVTKCPVCKEWIKPWAKGGPRRSMIYAFLFVILMIGAVFYIDTKPVSLAVPELTMDTSKIEIVSSERVEAKNEISLIGIVKNSGSNSIQGFKVTATYFDKAGKLLNVSDAYINGAFGAGETRPFKIRFSCGDPGLPVASYDHYKISVH